MNYSKSQLWERFQEYYTEFPNLGLALDLSRMNFGEDFFASMEPAMRKAFVAMKAVEAGVIANPDENRMVGHYWLCAPQLAPTPELRSEIESTVAAIKTFAAEVHYGKIGGSKGPFRNVLLIGIGGSALGPQFVAKALGQGPRDKLTMHFLDNTDPDGIDNVLSTIGPENLSKTLCVVVSKSGGTKETRNGMLETQSAYELAGLDFGRHAVAVTSQDGELDKLAIRNGWVRRFSMWDWVGGRTSELSAVGLLPAALQGIDIDAFIAGARACDEQTRNKDVNANPAAQMALMWHYYGNGKGSKNMVVLPYKDRSDLFSKYLQQLLIESLGKRLDLDGKVVNQGITVLGNKGSTDQHSYIQQLRDRLNNFFVVFIEVLRDRSQSPFMVEPDFTAGDYLDGFFQGTRLALYENGRESITLTVREVSPFSVGVLIALFERTVGLYATLININAYHQPGVEAGKKAATTVFALQTKAIDYLRKGTPKAFAPGELAAAVGAPDEIETVYKICEHLAGNPDWNVKKAPGKQPSECRYNIVS